ncbi:MAG: hypothetical protein QM711_18395 [Micropruina sp.]|uniref:hypothetical protein n=1 Tax=Micropruina sp. TaxID=2737536 RepID=UPI0039E6DDC1
MSSNTRINPDKVGRIAAKVATEAAYVITGLADIVAGTVQDVVKQGRQSYRERRAAGDRPVGDYARQVPQQVRSFVDELKDAYTGLSARGRTVFSDGFSSTAHRPAPAQPEPEGYQQPTSD